MDNFNSRWQAVVRMIVSYIFPPKIYARYEAF